LPRYDYKCNSCGTEFELTQTFKQAGSGTCPDCSGEGRRVYHAVPVIYKGSGFYTTDYGRPKPPADNGKETKDSKDSKDTSESKVSTPSDARGETAGTSSESTSKTPAASTPTSESKT
jgi:putative FmdB family regulatory protein